ncbi:MAG: SDR family oxidoreductase [Actinomycetes bacterium]
MADAAARAGVRRLVFTGILQSDLATDVPHFWHKTLAERDLAERSVPYVSLRPGAFFDQMDLLPGGGPRGGRMLSLWPADVRSSWVLSADVAESLVRLVDAPVADGTTLDLGWTRPVAMRELATRAGAALGRRVRLVKLPWPAVRTVGGLVGRSDDQVGDMTAMMRFFATGRYVADIGPTTEVLGAVPTPEAALDRWAAAPPLTRP